MGEEKYLVKHRRFEGLRFLLLAHPILTAVACVLALTVSLLGTYAWFTAQSPIEPMIFTTAKLRIELDTNKDKTVVKSFSNNQSAIDAQLSLINNLEGETDTDLKDEILAEWLEEYADTLDTILADTDRAAPMSFVFRSYTLTNGSNVPAYFRIDRAKLSGGSQEGAFAACYEIESTKDGLGKGRLIADSEGVLYCKEPLYPGDVITVNFVIYLWQIQSGKYAFSSEYAEIIQAANNAIFMSPGWEDVAEEMEPYIE